MRAALVLLRALVLVATSSTALAQSAPPADARGEVLASSAAGAAIGLALPATSAAAGCAVLVLSNGDLGQVICGACGLAAGLVLGGPAGSCGAALGAWLTAKRVNVDAGNVLAAALPGVVLGVASTVTIIAISTTDLSGGVGFPIAIVAAIAAVAAAPITVCGATWATPSGPVAEVPAPQPAPPRKRSAPPPKRRAPHPDQPNDEGGWTPPEPPPPPLLPQMGY